MQAVREQFGIGHFLANGIPILAGDRACVCMADSSYYCFICRREKWDARRERRGFHRKPW